MIIEFYNMDVINNNQNKKEIENKEIKEEENKNDNLTEKKNENKNNELKYENFKEIYSKINLIKQKHKEHSEKDKNIHFSINDYNIDKLMKDVKLKQIYQIFEQVNNNQNITNKKSVLFTPNYSVKKKLYEIFNRQSNLLNIEKFKNSNEGSTQNKMYSLFKEVNKLNKVFPVKKISYKKISSSLNKNKRKTINKRYFTTNSIIEKKYEPISSEKFFNSVKENINNNNNGKYTTNLSNFKNKSVFNKIRNDKNIVLNKCYSNTENNIVNWYENFTEKYNNNFYSLQINNLSNAIDRVTNNSNVKKRYNSNYIN